VRALRVTRRFDIHFCIYTEQFGEDEEDEEYDYCKKLEERYLTSIRKLLTPDTLRSSEPKTEIERYTRARLSSPDIVGQ
jgi:hypothetical protein